MIPSGGRGEGGLSAGLSWAFFSHRQLSCDSWGDERGDTNYIMRNLAVFFVLQFVCLCSVVCVCVFAVLLCGAGTMPCSVCSGGVKVVVVSGI